MSSFARRKSRKLRPRGLLGGICGIRRVAVAMGSTSWQARGCNISQEFFECTGCAGPFHFLEPLRSDLGDDFDHDPRRSGSGFGSLSSLLRRQRRNGAEHEKREETQIKRKFHGHLCGWPKDRSVNAGTPLPNVTTHESEKNLREQTQVRRTGLRCRQTFVVGETLTRRPNGRRGRLACGTTHARSVSRSCRRVKNPFRFLESLCPASVFHPKCGSFDSPVVLLTVSRKRGKRLPNPRPRQSRRPPWD